jgi:hypothetical protein
LFPVAVGDGLTQSVGFRFIGFHLAEGRYGNPQSSFRFPQGIFAKRLSAFAAGLDPFAGTRVRQKSMPWRGTVQRSGTAAVSFDVACDHAVKFTVRHKDNTVAAVFILYAVLGLYGLYFCDGGIPAKEGKYLISSLKR